MPLSVPADSTEVLNPLLEEGKPYRLKPNLGSAFGGLDDIEYFWVPKDPRTSLGHNLDERFQIFKFYNRNRWQEARLPVEVFIGLERPTKPTPPPDPPPRPAVPAPKPVPPRAAPAPTPAPTPRPKPSTPAPRPSPRQAPRLPSTSSPRRMPRSKPTPKAKPSFSDQVLLAYLDGGGTDTSEQIIIMGIVINRANGYLPKNIDEADICRTLSENFRWIVEKGGRYYLSGRFAQE